MCRIDEEALYLSFRIAHILSIRTLLRRGVVWWPDIMRKVVRIAVEFSVTLELRFVYEISTLDVLVLARDTWGLYGFREWGEV